MGSICMVMVLRWTSARAGSAGRWSWARGLLHASLGFGSFTIWLSAGINENKL